MLMTDFVPSMSNVDKVLHLYVEVRTVDDKELLEDNRSGLRMLQCPDVLPHSHRGFTTTTNSPGFSPKTPHRPRALSQSLPPSRCSSRHTVNFQLPNQDSARCPTATSHRDTLYGSVGQLSESRTPGMPHSGMIGPYCDFNDLVSHHNGVPEHSFPTVGRWSVPSSPASYRRLYDQHSADDENGTISVVKYGYVEKASVNQQSSLCQYDTDNPVPEDHIRLQKRNSDPGWHRDPENFIFSNYRPVHKTQNLPPFYKRNALEAVAKDATHRALREFGSPELKRRYESYIQENRGTDLTRPEQPQLSLHNKSPTLHSRSKRAEVSHTQGQTEAIRHTQISPFAGASPSLGSHRFSPSFHQQCVENKQTKSFPRSHLPAGKPTDIQHTISTNTILTNNYSKMVLPTCSNNSQTNCNSNASNYKFSHSTCQKHFNAQNITSPEDNLDPSSCYNVENSSKSVVDGSLFSKSDRVTMCTSPVPSMDPPVGCSSTTRYFCCENQQNAKHHWHNSPVYVQPHLRTDKTHYRSPQTMAGYGSTLLSPKCLSSSKSLSLPSSLNHTDLFHDSEMLSDHNVGFSNALKSENTAIQHYPCTGRKQRHQVSASSAKKISEVNRRGTLNSHQIHSVNRISRCEMYSKENIDNREQKCANHLYIGRKEAMPVKNTLLTVTPINESSSSEPSKVLHEDVPHRLRPNQTSSNTGSQVGRKSSCPL